MVRTFGSAATGVRGLARHSRQFRPHPRGDVCKVGVHVPEVFGGRFGRGFGPGVRLPLAHQGAAEPAPPVVGVTPQQDRLPALATGQQLLLRLRPAKGRGGHLHPAPTVDLGRREDHPGQG